jgi:hypothetical protein
MSAILIALLSKKSKPTVSISLTGNPGRHGPVRAFNLNIPRYVDTFEPEPEVDLQGFKMKSAI